MSLRFVRVTDIERDAVTLEVWRSNTELVMCVDETPESEYVVEFAPEGATFTAQEMASIVAHALRSAGLRVRKPDGLP